MELSRRSFLKCTGLTALAVATAGVTTGCSPVKVWQPEFKYDGGWPAYVGGVMFLVYTDTGVAQGDISSFVICMISRTGSPITVKKSDFLVVSDNKAFEVLGFGDDEDALDASIIIPSTGPVGTSLNVKGRLPDKFYVRFAQGGEKIYYQFSYNGTFWTAKYSKTQNTGIQDNFVF